MFENNAVLNIAYIKIATGILIIDIAVVCGDFFFKLSSGAQPFSTREPLPQRSQLGEPLTCKYTYIQ